MMLGPVNAIAAERVEDKLTIDNLWKILACEKPSDGARGPGNQGLSSQ